MNVRCGREYGDVEITKDEEKKLLRATFEENVKILKTIRSENESKQLGLTEIEMVALFELMSRHIHYKMQDYAEDKYRNIRYGGDAQTPLVEPKQVAEAHVADAILDKQEETKIIKEPAKKKSVVSGSFTDW